MELRTGNGLLLHQQTGADFDFSADAKGIDALVSDRLYCVRSHHLPVIILRTLIHSLNGLAIGSKAEQVEVSIAAKIRRSKDQRGPGRVAKRRETSVFTTKPNERSVASATSGWVACG